MGRELKRVPIDFEWPIDQLWKGFINPYRSMECKTCDGGGLNPETKKISDEWYGKGLPDKWVRVSDNSRYNDNAWCYHITDVEVEALVKAGRLRDVMGVSVYLDEENNKWMGWVDNIQIEVDKPIYPSAESVNEWARKGMGHDAINHWICTEARAKQLGVYGKCKYCKGEGVLWQSEEIKKLHDEWVDFEPPTGEGFQLWNTTTEGHPMTPVFTTLELLCEYCEKENISSFGYNGATKERWFEMLNTGLVCHKEGNVIFL